VVDDCKFTLFPPWQINVESLRNYFGEKIALYFFFARFLTFHFSYMMVVGLVFQIVVSVLFPLFNFDNYSLGSFYAVSSVYGVILIT